MSGYDWKPGDVAMLRCRDGQERVAMLTDRGRLSPLWVASSDDWGRLSDDIPVRPLAVIDPEDTTAVTNLVSALIAMCSSDAIRSQLRVLPFREVQAALREFAKPSQPKPEEPTGLGAVVEVASGARWLRAYVDRGRKQWIDKHGHIADYDEIDAVRILSHGVTPEATS